MIERNATLPVHPAVFPHLDRGAFAEAIESLGMNTNEFSWSDSESESVEPTRAIVYKPLGFSFGLNRNDGRPSVECFPNPRHDFDSDGKAYGAATLHSVDSDADLRLFKQWLWRCLVARSI